MFIAVATGFLENPLTTSPDDCAKTCWHPLSLLRNQKALACRQSTHTSILLMKYLMFSIFCLASLPLFTQTLSLRDYNQQRIKATRSGMLVLGGWGAANLIGGGILAATQEGEAKYFHQMNAAWGGINLGIATLSYFAAKKIDPAGFDTFQTIEEHYKTEKLFLFNAGLDLGYVATGLYLAERAKTFDKNQTRWKGFGKSIAVQGAFLFVFDLASYLVHGRHRKQLKPIVEGLGFTGNGVYLALAF